MNRNCPGGVRSRTMAPGTMSSLAVASTVSRSATGSKGLRFVADASVPPKEHATATTSAKIRVVMISLLGHADELTVGPPTSEVGAVERGAAAPTGRAQSSWPLLLKKRPPGGVRGGCDSWENLRNLLKRNGADLAPVGKIVA